MASPITPPPPGGVTAAQALAAGADPAPGQPSSSPLSSPPSSLSTLSSLSHTPSSHQEQEEQEEDEDEGSQSQSSSLHQHQRRLPAPHHYHPRFPNLPVPAPAPTHTLLGSLAAATRRIVALDWIKDAKVKTGKCRLCNGRVRGYAMQCGRCRGRICDECIEGDGDQGEDEDEDEEEEATSINQEIARDFLQNGCWCGFANAFNPAFRGRMPVPRAATTGGRAAKGKEKKKVERSRTVKADANAEDEVSSSGYLAERSSPLASSDVVNESSPLNSGEKKGETRAGKRRAKDDLATEPSSKKIRSSNDSELWLLLEEPSAPAKHTVVIGAGAVGLFAAYELALRTDPGEKVVVIDINTQSDVLASARGTGFVTVHGMKDEWVALVRTASAAWYDLRDNNDGFNRGVRFGNRFCLLDRNDEDKTDEKNDDKHNEKNNSEEGNNVVKDDVPAMPWLRHTEDETVAKDLDTMGRVEPLELTSWLHGACKKLGVTLHFNTHARAVKRDRFGRMTGLRVHDSNSRSKSVQTLPCTKLVIAAGPLTPLVLARLFPEPTIVRPMELKSHVKTRQWISVCSVLEPAEEGSHVPKNVALMIPFPNDQDGEKHGAIAISAHRATQTITFCTTTPDIIPNRRVLYMDSVTAPVVQGGLLRNMTAKYMDFGDHSGVWVETGAAYVSTGNGRNPVIGKVPGVRGEVWLAYGLGEYALGMAPGVGRIVAQMIRGEEVAEAEEIGRFGVSAVDWKHGKPQA